MLFLTALAPEKGRERLGEIVQQTFLSEQPAVAGLVGTHAVGRTVRNSILLI